MSAVRYLLPIERGEQEAQPEDACDAIEQIGVDFAHAGRMAATPTGCNVWKGEIALRTTDVTQVPCY